MREKLSNEQRHERFWCAFTHIWVAWIFVAYCAWAAFLNWKILEKPISGFSRPGVIELPFYILIVVVYVPIFWMILRGFLERFVVVLAAARIAIAVVAWFAPTLLNPLAALVNRVFFG